MSSLSPGGALGGPGEEVWTAQKQNLSLIFTHCTSGPQSLSGKVESLVRNLYQVSARRVAWVGLGGLCEVWWEADNVRGSRPHKGGFTKTHCTKLLSAFGRQEIKSEASLTKTNRDVLFSALHKTNKFRNL